MVETCMNEYMYGMYIGEMGKECSARTREVGEHIPTDHLVISFSVAGKTIADSL